MTVVVADTSPLNYLIFVGAVEVLLHLYGSVTIPATVVAELSDRDAPNQVREWLTSM
jgi:predicted nucleic acid-binding protein